MKPKPLITAPSKAPKRGNEFPPVVAAVRGGDSPGREASGIKYGHYIADLIEKDEFPVFDDFWN